MVHGPASELVTGYNNKTHGRHCWGPALLDQPVLHISPDNERTARVLSPHVQDPRGIPTSVTHLEFSLVSTHPQLEPHKIHPNYVEYYDLPYLPTTPP